ncbi:malate synthase G [Leucothrix arctica]|uniref:Malate synthase G n=2 Tax=Leucothrix arctica TaxID=1481894 RepID=A0A317C3N4_9GAMM|nr:malate synthase G [Leucothrix arctica]
MEGLTINTEFRQFVEDEVLPLTTLSADQFWEDVQSLVEEFSPINAALLAKRDDLQAQIDTWHKQNDYAAVGIETYQQFLTDIGYLVDEGEDFAIQTNRVDAEIATMAGPQLVVPMKNARFALNAVNARWGSLYDSLYGTDVIDRSGKLAPTSSYNPERGQEVINRGRKFLDETLPLAGCSHTEVFEYRVENEQFVALVNDGSQTGLKQPQQFVAYDGPEATPTALFFKHNGLLVELVIDPNSSIGKADTAGVGDIRLESALTAIMDCEDSVAAVDSEEKIEVYRNCLGLMTGDLEETVNKGGKSFVRKMQKNTVHTRADGMRHFISRRSLMFIRNVGHLMTINTIRDSHGAAIPEGILDGIITALIGSIDVRKELDSEILNSREGSIYIVKPKMHGPEEVAFTCALFSRIEQMLGLSANTIKLGIMDEERRTTVNLKACIREAKHRCVFINTGFLDRTGDEIHTSMEAGPFMLKDQIKTQPWIAAYENWNVDIGLACGLQGRAQIGKGMWAKPDEMAEMMAVKIGHPLAGANTAWVPSPTAATLHAMHYHQVDVFAEQEKIKLRDRASLQDLLTIPLLTETLTAEQVEQELENNIQGILGYVVRWIDQGIGCSKVPDINNVGLMEDRATLRISSQHIANWLHHDLCTKAQVLSIMQRMAAVVDEQNQDDPDYRPMADDTDNNMAFNAAKFLIFLGCDQPNGYTEPLLHHYRIEQKAQFA